jgi:chemotaxis signal transduction protein
MAEVSGVSEWHGSIPIPSQTPFVTAVIRQGKTVLPVFDLAALLHRTVRGNSLLCLRVKHVLGEMAICIDEDIPVLHACDPAAVQTYHGTDLPAEGSYTNGLDEILILSISRLGAAA